MKTPTHNRRISFSSITPAASVQCCNRGGSDALVYLEVVSCCRRRCVTRRSQAPPPSLTIVTIAIYYNELVRPPRPQPTPPPPHLLIDCMVLHVDPLAAHPLNVHENVNRTLETQLRKYPGVDADGVPVRGAQRHRLSPRRRPDLAAKGHQGGSSVGYDQSRAPESRQSPPKHHRSIVVVHRVLDRDYSGVDCRQRTPPTLHTNGLFRQ